MLKLLQMENATLMILQVIAREIAQMLAAKEEYLRVSRTFLREFVRSLLRIDFDFALFSSHLFAAVTEDFTPATAPVSYHYPFRYIITLFFLLSCLLQ